MFFPRDAFRRPAPGADPHFVDVVQYADKIAGRIVKRLKELGLRDNTIPPAAFGRASEIGIAKRRSAQQAGPADTNAARGLNRCIVMALLSRQSRVRFASRTGYRSPRRVGCYWPPRLAVAGLAVSALPRASVVSDMEQKRLSILRARGWPLRRTLSVVRHRREYVSKALAAFLDELQSHVQTTKAGRKAR